MTDGKQTVKSIVLTPISHSFCAPCFHKEESDDKLVWYNR